MKGDFHHLPRDTLCEGDALDERREVAPNGGAEQEGGDPEPEMVEDGTRGDEVVECAAWPKPMEKKVVSREKSSK